MARMVWVSCLFEAAFPVDPYREGEIGNVILDYSCDILNQMSTPFTLTSIPPVPWNLKLPVLFLSEPYLRNGYNIPVSRINLRPEFMHQALFRRKNYRGLLMFKWRKTALTVIQRDLGLHEGQRGAARNGKG